MSGEYVAIYVYYKKHFKKNLQGCHPKTATKQGRNGTTILLQIALPTYFDISPHDACYTKDDRICVCVWLVEKMSMDVGIAIRKKYCGAVLSSYLAWSLFGISSLYQYYVFL